MVVRAVLVCGEFEQGENGISVVQAFVAERSEQFKNVVAEQISQRTIVLENAKQQTDAAKSKKKAANMIARQQKASNKFIKRRGLCDVTKEGSGSLSVETVEALHASWVQYAASTMQGASTHQRQARLLAMQLIGAKVRIAYSSNPSIVGLEGIVLKDTANTLVVRTKTGAHRTIVKATARIVVELEGSDKTGILHGSKLLPVKQKGRPRVA